MNKSIILIMFFFFFIFISCADKTTNPSIATPQIIDINPISTYIGDSVLITGKNFGIKQDTNIVFFNNVKATEFISWCDSAIKVKVPLITTSGKVWLFVNGKKSNEVDIKINVITSLIETVLINSGSFQMGSTGYYPVETAKPVHTVTLTKTLLMGKYEVTQAQ